MSFKDGVSASVHVAVTTLGNGEVKHDIEDILNFKQVKRKFVRPATNIDQSLHKQQIHIERDILNLPNFNQVKRKTVIPASTIDQFLKIKGHIDDETKCDSHTTKKP